MNARQGRVRVEVVIEVPTFEGGEHVPTDALDRLVLACDHAFANRDH